MQFDLATYNGRIDFLASINSAKSYVEIGVATGATFFPVKIPLKVAVDPRFQFDFKNHAETSHDGENTRFFQKTSDKFFWEYSLIDRQCNFLELPKDGGVSQTLP